MAINFYKDTVENARMVRDQLKIFEIEHKYPDISENDDKKDWDFVNENTKTNTHGFHAYPAMMIPQIASKLISLFGRDNQTLFDPFCGSGTSLVEAKIAGLDAYGIDINPLALLLSRVKTTPLSVQILKKYAIKICERYLSLTDEFKQTSDEDIIPNYYNIYYWFHPKVSRQLSILKSAIDKISDKQIREFFLVAFSHTVRNVSYTRKGEFKLYRISQSDILSFRTDVIKTYFKKVQENIVGMDEFSNNADSTVFTSILNEDTRFETSIPESSIDLVVTSPPYGDSRTTVAYGQYSRLSLQWLGFPWEEIRGIDVISLGGKRTKNSIQDSSSNILIDVFNSVKQKDERRALDVGSFFLDFDLCLKEIHRICKTNATMCFVIGNRTVKNIKIPMDEILIDLGKNNGLQHIETIQRNIPNKRMPSKNSPTNVKGSIGSTMTKEHIVILKKSK